ncbi:uncharacterized protein DUF3515 [Nocardioides sp. J9]|uniref:DUF3515 family protein n=1 Tax=unclassified Nocardioides TaxID=2615069 RepID=UPI0004B3BA02|nr:MULTISPECIES: DUF3515 family protein [unclassified Nocardioides]TWG98352.1 uncharacterized protein DUF3515 [Nocardioides sp. J9]
MPRPAAALLSLLALSPALAACGGPVEVDVPSMTDADRATCDAFTADLPDTLAEQERVEIDPADAPAAAFGDPAVVVRCGVAEPEDFDLASSCELANGVGWFIPVEQYDDQGLDLTITAAGYRPRVEVVVPADYRPSGGAAVMSALAPLVEEHLTLVEACD